MSLRIRYRKFEIEVSIDLDRIKRFIGYPMK